MKESLHNAVYAIPVPADLNAAVLAACRAEQARLSAERPLAPVVRLIPATATAVACVAVIGVALYAVGHQPPAPPHTPVPDESTTTTTTSVSTENSRTTTTATSVQTSVRTTATTTTTTANRTEDTTGKTESSTSATTEDTTRGTSVTTESPTTNTVTDTTEKTTTTGTTSTTTQSTTTTTTTPTGQYSSTTAGHTTRPTTVGGTPSLMAGIHEVASFQTMTLEQLQAYYGEKAVPAWVPEGMEMRLDPSFPLGIYQKNASLIAVNESTWNRLLNAGIVRDADVVYDHNQLRWCDFIDGRRELIVGLSTAPYPRYKLGDMSRFDDPITVGGTTVQAAYFKDSADCWCWSVLIPKGDIEYYIEGWNITEDEFVQMLESLIA